MTAHSDFRALRADAPQPVSVDRSPLDRPRGGRLVLDLKGHINVDFDAARWCREWFTYVGSMGGRHIGKLILCYSRRRRSTERLRLLRELRSTPGAAGAVFRAYCSDLARQEGRLRRLERAAA